MNFVQRFCELPEEKTSFAPASQYSRGCISARPTLPMAARSPLLPPDAERRQMHPPVHHSRRNLPRSGLLGIPTLTVLQLRALPALHCSPPHAQHGCGRLLRGAPLPEPPTTRKTCCASARNILEARPVQFRIPHGDLPARGLSKMFAGLQGSRLALHTPQNSSRQLGGEKRNAWRTRSTPRPEQQLRDREPA